MLDIAIGLAGKDFTLDAAFQAGPGITVLAGPSGAGKSTIANVIAGLARPDHGQVTIGGRVLFDSGTGLDVRPADRRVGYVLQDALLFPHLSVEQNLRYGAKASATPGIHAFDDILALLDLAPLLDRKPKSLSGGEQQRVAIGRALLSQPDCLVLDEPFANLDAGRRDRLMGFLETLRQQNRLPILYISHNWTEIVRLADHLVLMEGGRVAADGSVAAVLADTAAGPLVPAGTVLDTRVEEANDGLSRLDTGGGSVFVPTLSLAVGSPVRIFVDARDVAIGLSEPTGLSIQNNLQATITDIRSRDPAHVDVWLTLEGGQALRAQITGRARKSLRLEAGQRVFALIKSVALDRDMA